MKVKNLLACALLTAFSIPAFGQAEMNYKKDAGTQAEISYKKDVYPIFKDYCISCHAPGGKGYLKSGFDLRTYQSLMKGTKFGPVIQAGSSMTSTLNILVSGHASPAISMPYGIKDGLPKDKSRILNKWVDQGAKDN